MPRLTSAMQVSALIRRIQAAGDFATVLTRGDASAGAILMICTQRGRNVALLEQALGGDSVYHWQKAGVQLVDNEALLNDYLTNRRRYDPDLWLIELDIADAERFVAEMTAVG